MKKIIITLILLTISCCSTILLAESNNVFRYPIYWKYDGTLPPANNEDKNEDSENKWSITDGELPEATVNTEFTFDLSTRIVPKETNGLSWNSKKIPEWLDLNEKTGVLKGTPNKTNDEGITIPVSVKKDGEVKEAVFSIKITGDTFSASSFGVGKNHTCVLTDSGGVKCWGRNDKGQLGDGTNNDSLTPVNVKGLDGKSGKVTDITLIGDSSCAIKDSRLYCWGLHMYSDTESNVPVANRHYKFNQVKSANYSSYKTYKTACAIREHVSTKGINYLSVDDVYDVLSCWGNGMHMMQSYSFKSYSSPSTNTIFNTPNYPVAANIKDYSIGQKHVCAIFDYQFKIGTGRVEIGCLGSDAKGQIGQTSSIGKKNGKYNHLKIVDIPGTPVKIDSGTNHNCVLNNAGNVYCWGQNYYKNINTSRNEVIESPVKINGFNTVVDIRLTDATTCVLFKGKENYTCMGYQTGGNGKAMNLPEMDKSLVSIKGDNANHTCLKNKNGLLCKGNNQYGQLGDETTNNSPDTFVKVKAVK